MAILLAGSCPVKSQINQTDYEYHDGDLPREHLVLVTDRDLYMTGETIWFTVRYTIRNGFDPGKFSKVVYVELFSSNKEALHKDKLMIKGGKAEGTLVIPEEVASGIYFLRAYTNFQRNFPPESYPMTALTIVNPEIPFHREIPSNDSIAIIPEGGQLVYGLTSRVAIRLNPELSTTTNSIWVSGQHRQFISPVSFYENGIGSCMITPADSLEYFLKVALLTGDTITEPFPSPVHEGFIPAVDKTPSGLVYRITGTLPADMSSHDLLTLSIRSAEMTTLCERSVDPGTWPVSISLSGEDLSEGIYYFVLESNNGDILHVLPVYLPPGKTRQLTVGTDKNNYGKREPVEVVIQPDSPLTQSAHLSVSVVKHGSHSGRSYGLPGLVIDNPFLLDSYQEFSDPVDTLTERQTGICMILYTPRVNTVFFRNRLSAYEHPVVSYLPEIRDISLCGKVINKITGESLAGVPVNLSVLDQSQFHMTRTREQGQFIFVLNNLSGDQDLFLCPGPDQLKEAKILINTDFSSDYPDPLYAFPTLDSTWKNTLEEMWINAQVTSFFNRDTVTEAAKKTSRNIFGESNTRVSLADYIELSSLYEVFYEIVPYVHIKKKKDRYKLEIINDRLEVFEDPLIMLDNVLVYDVDELMKIPPALVDRVEVINGSYIYGNFLLGGVVMIFTRTDNYAGIRFPEGSVFLEYLTRAPQHGYFAPEYDQAKSDHNPVPDFRNLLYWNPDLLLPYSPASVSFFTSDHTGIYDIIVRGFTADGQPCFGKTSFQVQ
jgi:hypothetical protein